MTIARATIVAVIPAFNEAETIPHVVAGLHHHGIENVRVVDNGSTDGTAEIARAAGADVLHEPRRGYGQACFSGCETLPSSCEWILFCDADGSDDIDSLPRLIEAAEDADFVLGNRRATAEGRAALTPVQNFGNALAGSLLRFLVGHRYRDLGPMRLIRRASYERLNMQDRGFGWTVEMQARAAQVDARIVEVGVPYHTRRGGESKISGTIAGSAKAGAVILGTLGRFAIERWQHPLTLLAAIFLLLGAAMMIPAGAFRTPGAVPSFLLAAGIMCIGFSLSWMLRSVTVGIAFAVAVGTRLLLLPMEPGTDIWRYVWEGLIQNAGFNPYLLPPTSEALTSLRTPWWPLINNASIPALYPPLVQLIFRGISAVSATAITFKLAIIAADLGVCALLWRRFRTASLLYLWNPLVIYVFAGGGHYDSLFLLPLVAAWMLSGKAEADKWTALLLGLSFAIKYVSAPLIAFHVLAVWRRGGWFRAFICGGLAALPFLLALTVFWIPFGIHPLGSGDFSQYARSAEFLPRLIGLWWEQSLRFNAIFLVPYALAITWRLFRSRDFRAFAEESLLATYLVSPAIHAWYFTWVIPFAAASRNLGVRLIGIGAFVYFLLEHRQAMHVEQWRQTWLEFALMWMPLIAGFAWTRCRSHAPTRPGRPHPPEPARAPVH